MDEPKKQKNSFNERLQKKLTRQIISFKSCCPYKSITRELYSYLVSLQAGGITRNRMGEKTGFDKKTITKHRNILEKDHLAEVKNGLIYALPPDEAHQHWFRYRKTKGTPPWYERFAYYQLLQPTGDDFNPTDQRVYSILLSLSRRSISNIIRSQSPSGLKQLIGIERHSIARSLTRLREQNFYIDKGDHWIMNDQLDLFLDSEVKKEVNKEVPQETKKENDLISKVKNMFHDSGFNCITNKMSAALVQKLQYLKWKEKEILEFSSEYLGRCKTIEAQTALVSWLVPEIDKAESDHRANGKYNGSSYRLLNYRLLEDDLLTTLIQKINNANRMSKTQYGRVYGQKAFADGWCDNVLMQLQMGLTEDEIKLLSQTSQ